MTENNVAAQAGDSEPRERSPYVLGVKPSTWDAQIAAQAGDEPTTTGAIMTPEQREELKQAAQNAVDTQIGGWPFHGQVFKRLATPAAILSLIAQVEDDQGKNLDLCELMIEISEVCYCAHWMDGLEFAIWNAIQSGNLEYGMGCMDIELLSRIAKLSVKTGQWAVFDEVAGAKTITLKEWASVRARASAETGGVK